MKALTLYLFHNNIRKNAVPTDLIRRAGLYCDVQQQIVLEYMVIKVLMAFPKQIWVYGEL